MKKLFLEIDGNRIFVCHSNETGKPVILIHGNSGSHAIWLNQLESDLLSDYNLLAIDLPGCGKSNPSPSPELHYNFEYYAGLINKLISELNLPGAVLVGNSLGGHVAIECSAINDQLAGLMIFGTPPVKNPLNIDEAFLPYDKFGYFLEEEISVEMAEKIIMDCNNQKEAKIIVEDFLHTDPKFRSKLGESLSQGRFANEHEIIESTNLPVAILHGNNDVTVNGEYLQKLIIKNLWQKQIILKDDCGHYPQFEHPEWFNQTLKEFLDEITIA